MFRQRADKKIKIPLNLLTKEISPPGPFAGFIRDLMLILKQSPTGFALLQSALEQNISVGIDPFLAPSSSFVYPARNHFDFGYQPDFLQKTEKGQGRYLISFIIGLCRTGRPFYHDKGDSFPSQDFPARFRCEEAGICSTMIMIGWELRAAGHTFFWRHLLSGPCGDMTFIFESAVGEDPQAQFDGRAVRAAFHQWFAEQERIEACDFLGI